MLRLIKYFAYFLIVVFIFPALAHLGVWSLKNKPGSWHEADWSSAGILAKRPPLETAEIMLLSARTGGLKGAFATHSWIVMKEPGRAQYDRFDVVGWGRPVRKNAYDADGRWYSNKPQIDFRLTGDAAIPLIAKLKTAINSYKWREYGDYTLWPGPNSNTFVSTIVQQVPELKATTVSTGVGRDFPSDGRFFGRRADGSYFVSANGYIGAILGGTAGLELNFLGLVAGVNPATSTIKVPAFGMFKI